MSKFMPEQSNNTQVGMLPGVSMSFSSFFVCLLCRLAKKSTNPELINAVPITIVYPPIIGYFEGQS